MVIVVKKPRPKQEKGVNRTNPTQTSYAYTWQLCLKWFGGHVFEHQRENSKDKTIIEVNFIVRNLQEVYE